MKIFIENFLITVIESKVTKKIIEIVYEGVGISLNDYYSQGHWSKRSALKKKYKPIFRELFIKSEENGELEWMDQFVLIILYNSRHDPDNVTGLEKIFIDSLKKDSKYSGYIEDDSKKYYKGMFIVPDDTLKTNTFKFILLKLK